MRRYELPWPPSVNHYWRNLKTRTVLSRKGRQYRIDVAMAIHPVAVEPMTGSLLVRINVYPPDKRRRDLDNILKALFDAMQHVGVYEDDNQIDKIEIERKHGVPNGLVDVQLEYRDLPREDE